MATNVAIDAIATALVAQIATLVPTPVSGKITPTVDQPILAAQKYIGTEFKDVESFRRGIAGRCPAVRVRYTGTKNARRTIGRRVQRVESTFAVIVASDSHRAPGAREALIAATEAVRGVVAARHFGLQISGMKFESITTLQDDEQMLIFSMLFSTRHYVDYTKVGPFDAMTEADGVIVDASVTRSALVAAPALSPVGTPGSTSRSYALIGVDANGLPTLLGDIATIANSAATLNGTDLVRLTWPAIAGIVTYKVVRTASSGTPSTTGVIGATSGLTFDDTGIAPSEGVPEDAKHEDVEVTFA